MKDGSSNEQGPSAYYNSPDRTPQDGTAVKEKDPGVVNLDVERVFVQDEVSELISKVRKAERAKAEKSAADIARAAYERGQRAGAKGLQELTAAATKGGQ